MKMHQLLLFIWHRRQFINVAIFTITTLLATCLAVLDDVRLEVVPVVFNPVIATPSETTTTSGVVIKNLVIEDEEEDSAEDFAKIAPQQQQWIVDYLLRYGYLDFSYIEQTTTSFKSAPQRLVDLRYRNGGNGNSDPVTNALFRFQQFSGLRPSGKIDFATRQQLVERRCGVRDVDRDLDATTISAPRLKRRYAASPNIRWKRKRLTYKFLNHSASLGADVSRKLVERALNQWAKAAQLDVVEEMAPSNSADIKFLFARKHHGDAYRFDGNGAVLAHAFFPGELRGGEVHFDDDEDWFDRDGVDTRKMNGVDLFAVALHEIGHALGLGHSAVPDSVMNPWYNNYASDPRLGDDDLHALTFLYGSGSLTDEVTSKKPPDVPVGSKPDLENPSTPVTEDQRVPDVCDTDFDAISLIRGKIFAFRRNNLWRFEGDGSVSPGFPMLASDFFMGLPSHVEQIDAFYERRVDHDVIIFSGLRYWRFRTNQLIPGFPPNGRPILELGLPGDVQRIDAAFVWSGNLFTYIVARDRYWRLDEIRNHVDFTYPRPVDRFWRGVPFPLNSAFLNTDGVTYFVVETSESTSPKTMRRFIPFDDYRLEAARSRPIETTKLWTGCLALDSSLEETRAMTLNSNNGNKLKIVHFVMILVPFILAIL